MKLPQIIELDRLAITLRAALGPLLAPPHADNLNALERLTGEVRQFATCWDNADEAGRAAAVAGIAPSPAAGMQYAREACVDRLIQALRPE